MEKRTPRGITAVLVSAIFAVPAAAAPAPPKANGAQFGAFYDLGVPDESFVAGGWTQARYGTEWDINGPANATLGDGPRWWANWDECWRGGSTITEVRWGAAKTLPSTSARHAFRVTDTGGTIFATSANLRDDLYWYSYPNLKNYVAGASSCRAQLRIDQIGGTGTEPAKRYWVNTPRAIAQDVQPPSVAVATDPGWIAAGTNSTTVAWSTTDNFDGSGFGNQHVIIDAVGVRAAGWWREVGDHQAVIGLSGVPDGVHTVRVRADGDGTADGQGTATLRVDRTPPAAVLSLGNVAPGFTRVDINVNDAPGGSGTANWSVAAPDTAVVSNASLGTDRLARVDLRRFDGADVQLVVNSVDAAGNEAMGHSNPIRVDVSAPSVGVVAPTGWTPGLLDSPLAIALADNRQDGVGNVTATINTATDGSGSGNELPLASYRPTQLGQSTLSAPLPVGIGDGAHRITVVASDPEFPAQLHGSGQAVVQIDTSSPQLGNPSAWTVSPATGAKYTLTLPGLSDSGSGVAKIRVLASPTITAATPTSQYRVVGSALPVEGGAPTTAQLDLTGFIDGRHATLIEVTDGAGNVSQANGPTIVVDRTAPNVTATIAKGTTPKVSWTQRDTVGFGSCLSIVEIQGSGTNVAWQQVAEMAGSAVPATGATVELPMTGLSNGDYRVRVTACDAAGNKASSTATLAWRPDSPSGATQNAKTEVISYRLAELYLSGGGNPRVKVTPSSSASVKLGRVITVEGIIERTTGTRGATSLVLVDSAGTPVAGATSDAQGRFRLTGAVRRGGVWRVEVAPAGSVVGRVNLKVPAGLTQQVNTRNLRLGDTLVVTGRLTPGPLAASKLLQLQWKDGRSWRPIANVTADSAGAFNVSYRFRRAAGYAIQMRIAVPAERGWPFTPVNGKPFSVKVV